MNENQNEYVDINAHDNYPDSEQTIEIPTMKVIPLKKICMTIGELPTSYLETMTYYEMLIWFIEYLKNNIIPTINNNASAIQEVQSVVLALQNYINDYKDSIDSDVEELEDYMNNYFENLDVQEEINNKLDDMLEDGVLEQIIEQFLQLTSLICFDNVAGMKASVNLTNGSYAKTLGYYSKNDGGMATYKIRTITNNDVVDEASIIALSDDTLIAELIIENDTINFVTLGAKPNDNTFDNKNYLLKYQTICNNLGKQIKLIIPNGTWYFSPTHLSRIGGFNIEGVGGYVGRNFISPIIHAIGNQDYIWKFGGLSDMGSSQIPYNNTNTGNNIKNLTFMSANYSINYGCLVLEYANYGIYEKIFFSDITGTGLYIRSSWENYYNILSFRTIKDFTKPCIMLAEIRSVSGVSANISSSSFDKIMFENIAGDCIKSELGSGFVNNQIGEINVEYSYASSGTATRITSETDLTGMTPLFLFNGNMSGVTIDSINMTGLNSYHSYIAENGVNYYFKSIFNTIGGGTTEFHRYDINIGKISARSMVQILTAHNPYDGAMIFSLGDYVETSNDTQNVVFDKFDLINAGYVHYNSILTRRNRINNIPYNTIKLYQNDSLGYLTTDTNALGDKICLQRGGGAITQTGFRYPYDYDSNNIKTKWLLRIKTDSEGAYGFVLRGYHNGDNVNTTYSQTGLTANTWYIIEIEMNYDFNSIVNLVNLNASCLVDTLTQI